VVRLDDDQVAVRPGDGVVFDEGHPEQDEQGGRVYEVHEQRSEPQQPRRVELVFGRGSVNWNAVSIGALLWKTDDPALRRRLERTYASDRPLRRGVIGLRVWGAPGESLFVSGEDDQGRRAVVSWPGPLQAARKHPLDEALAREQLGRLGDTRYELGSVELELPQPVMAPKSVLNDLRRRLVMELDQQQLPARHAIAQPDALVQWRRKIEDQPRAEDPASQLAVLVRNEQQLSAVLQWRPDGGLPRPAIVYCDYEDVRRYRDAVRQARDHGMPVGLATLRIIKPGEVGLLRHIVRAEGDAVLVRNLAALALFRAEAPQCELVGDYALNVANDLTADLLLEAGLARITPSYDMNWSQFEAFARRTPAERLEAVVHQHLPMFHMEHCVFAAVLSSGKDWRDCGRPCDQHRVELRDRAGAPLPLLADTGCRNTVFNAVAQSAAEYLPSMQRLGLRYFRVELLRETRDETCALLQHYSRVLAGLDSGRGAWRQLQVLNQLGVTRGTLQLA
jgi:putative protease